MFMRSLVICCLALGLAACAGATPDDGADAGRPVPDVRTQDTDRQDTTPADVGAEVSDTGEELDVADVADVNDVQDEPEVVDPPDVADTADTQPDTPDVGCLGPGCACTVANAVAVCEGLACVDGYCCDQACDGVCENCGLAGTEGTCSPYGTLADPEGECTQTAAASCGTTGWCDGAGACEFYDDGIFCDDGEACSTNDRCDGAGNCAGTLPPTCGPGEGNECCVGTCADGAGCQTEASACPDSCGANELSAGASCSGCGAAGAVGSCSGGTTYRCDAISNNPCQEVSCGGSTYWCTNVGSVWAWRQANACDDGDSCTHSDRCASGSCGGTSVDCTDTACADRECNGSASCTVIPNTGAVCNDGDLCTYNDRCDAAGNCGSGTATTCVDSLCIDRECNGTSTCDEFPLTGTACDDGDPCTWGDVCAAGAVCQPGTAIDCTGMDTACQTFSCDGTSQCAASAKNVGGACDDGNALTDDDVCQADGTCLGDEGCPPPAAACVTGTQSTDGCSNARVLGRVSANNPGINVSGDTCGARDRFDSSGDCWDANNDQTFRLYMREGETVSLDYETGDPCSFDEFSWSGTLKIFENNGCDDTSCGNRVYCEDRETRHQTTYVAPRDGWIIIVADGSSAFDDEGEYDLAVRLTCSTPDCGCD